MLKQAYLITLLLLFLMLLMYYACCVRLPQDGWECFCVYRNQKEIPVAYYNQQTRAPERKILHLWIECLTLVESLQHFNVYLIGHKSKLFTDHEHSWHWWTQPVWIIICGDGYSLSWIFHLKSIIDKEKTILYQMPYLDKVGMNCLLYSAKMWWAAFLQTESLSLLTPISTVGESEVEFSPNTQGSLLSADNAYVPWSSHLSFCLFVNTQD